MSRLAFTREVIDGIIAATAHVLSDDSVAEGGALEDDAVAIKLANEWAHAMREWMKDPSR